MRLLLLTASLLPSLVLAHPGLYATESKYKITTHYPAHTMMCSDYKVSSQRVVCYQKSESGLLVITHDVIVGRSNGQIIVERIVR